jgi:hypothetical protein
MALGSTPQVRVSVGFLLYGGWIHTSRFVSCILGRCGRGVVESVRGQRVVKVCADSEADKRCRQSRAETKSPSEGCRFVSGAGSCGVSPLFFLFVRSHTASTRARSI